MIFIFVFIGLAIYGAVMFRVGYNHRRSVEEEIYNPDLHPYDYEVGYECDEEGSYDLGVDDYEDHGHYYGSEGSRDDPRENHGKF